MSAFSQSGTQYTQHWPSLVSPDWWLNQLHILTTGQPKSAWRWIPGQTAFSTHLSVLVGFLGYLFMVFGIQFLMRFKKSPFKLEGITQAHNLFLSVASAFLFLGFLEQIIPMIMTKGFVFSFCDEFSYTQPLEYLYFLNYLFKWVEFIDTLLLVLKKKQLTSIGIRPWWKKHVTTLQISQFIIDIGFVVFSQYTNMAYHNYPDWPHMGNCRGTRNAAFIGTILLSSYLILFIQFFANTYKKPLKKISKDKKDQ
ncbi:Fatty acyl-CoA elongase/Polyunsaturated fatty acid specific elongation enzyme [Mycoemilia scoparia]|uniref:Elongation of fatty acids protein n=1 Tax=Mycoemilia scoparia TaxID=417184 RepID=A0A9W8DR96_9FUNG|nr:Fatty acyl-CoA elongase/Polyunsaturated fatty acid specific elongation enzyme [Mycoemilia scoparia]